MKLMLLTNVATEADLANGTRGIVTDIILDPREGELTVDAEGLTRLKYPPAMILFKPEKCTLPPIPGLPHGTIPLFPKKTAITIKKGRHTLTVQRLQYCLTGGYGLTDFKAQGQTMGKTVIDIKKTTHRLVWIDERVRGAVEVQTEKRHPNIETIRETFIHNTTRAGVARRRQKIGCAGRSSYGQV